MSEINVTSLDFEQIKENIKTFLRDKPEFEDYNFEGSSLGYLINLLSYNTMYNAYYLHMVANEMFLDSAQTRKNVVSRAKAIGYTPTSSRSASAFINVRLYPDGSPTEIFIPEGTKFTSKIDNKTYNFHTRKAYTVKPALGVYLLENMEIFEGIRLTHKYTVDNTTKFANSQFLIPNPSTDTSLLTVKVQKSSSEPIIETFFLHQDINTTKADSRVYFLNETDGNKYEVSFGDGIVGKSLVQGNIVILDYCVTAGEEANQALTFSPVTSIGGITNTVITTVQPASGGLSNESSTSIKYLAPLAYQAQNRMVTKSDYETIIKKEYPSIDSIRVWGGEENTPKEYGKVFVSIKPAEGVALSEPLKLNIINNIIKPKNMVSIEVEIKEPFYIYLNTTVDVAYNSKVTVDSENTIKQTVKDTIIAYNTNELNSFSKDFRFSKFINTVSASHTAVQNVLANFKLLNRLYVSLEISQQYIIDFSNALEPVIDELGNTCLSSSGFKFNGFDAYLKDDGLGKVMVYKMVDGKQIIISENVGEIDYKTGIVTLKKFYTPQILSGEAFIEVSVKPKIFNIESNKNQILLIEDQYLTINMTDESLG